MVKHKHNSSTVIFRLKAVSREKFNYAFKIVLYKHEHDFFSRAKELEWNKYFAGDLSGGLF